MRDIIQKPDCKVIPTNFINSGAEKRMEVVFGTPSKFCSGAGVCVVAKRFRSTNPFQCPTYSGWICQVSPNEVQFRFRKDSLPAEVFLRHFSHSGFVVEEPFRLPAYFIEQKSKKTSFWVLPGVYPIVGNQYEITITFNFS